MERTPLLPPLLSPAGPPIDRAARLRLMLLALSVSLWAVAIVVRLVQLQLFGKHELQRLATRQRESTQTLHARRGPILDRNRRPLALSVEHESIYAVPSDIEDPQWTSQKLARTLGLNGAAQKELLASLQSRRAFVWVKRKADIGMARAVKDLQLDGVGFLPETARFYPQRELAAHVVGFVNVDNEGAGGIEYAFDELIRGKEEKITVQRDARRRPVGRVDKPSTEGHSIVLTLDEAIQHAAENELERAMASTAATAGLAVVMDPRTGDILALANRPTFNPNKRVGGSDARINRAVVYVYEPGSIFKVVTAAAALEQKVVTPDETIDCGGGFIEVAPGERINDHAIFHTLPFREVIARSSDVGVVRVAQRLGSTRFEEYVRRFGFGAPTGVELPGESRGILHPRDRWSARSLPSLSFGQEISVNALQMVAAMGAIANGGSLMKPIVVRQIENAEGEVVRSATPTTVRRVLAPATTETLTQILTEVVRHGTGKRAAVPGYTVAGKTGTAQMTDARGGYSMIDHVASFVGFVPASRPALVILVSLEKPRGVLNQGGDVAAPVFAAIAERALHRLAIPPDDPSRLLRPGAEPVIEARAGARDVARKPVPASTIAATGMPSMLGLSAREAAALAVRYGLMVDLEGSGRVIDQTPRVGQAIEPGMTCRLTLDRGGWVHLPAPTPAPRAPRIAQAHTGGTSQVRP